MGEERKGGICGKATKGTARKETGMPCKGKSTGKGEEVKESRERRDGACGYATRSTARKVKEEFSGRIEEKSRGTLWQRNTRGSMPTRVRVVHREGNSVVPGL